MLKLCLIDLCPALKLGLELVLQKFILLNGSLALTNANLGYASDKGESSRSAEGRQHNFLFHR